MNKPLLVLGTILPIFTWETAHACSPTVGQEALDEASLEGFPTNGVVFAYEVPTWLDSSGTPVQFDRDVGLSNPADGQRTIDAWRPRGLRPNTEYRKMCGTVVCGTFTTTDPDMTEPALGIVVGMATVYSDGGGGCGNSCGDSSYVSMEVAGLDSAGDQFVLTYIGETAEVAASLERPTAAYYASTQDPTISASLYHRVEGVALSFGNTEGSCFSIALMDRAGNIGPRSEPQCYVPDPEPGSCSVAGGASLWPILLALMAAPWVRRRRV